MAIVALPLENEIVESNFIDSVCSSTEVPLKSVHTHRQAYIDTEYRQKVFHGEELELMPYKRFVSTTTQSPGTWGNSSNPMTFSSCWGGNIVQASYPAIELAEEKASEVFYSKLAKRDSFNVGVALAELRETIGLIGSTAVRLNSAFSDLRKGRVRDAMAKLGLSENQRGEYLRGFPIRHAGKRIGSHRKFLEHKRSVTKDSSLFASSAWLELNYGWMPLLYDVHGAAEHTANTLYRSRADLILTCFGEGHFADEQWINTRKYTGECTARVNYTVHLMVTDFALRYTASLGLTNPLLVAWEKIPFSFVYDWFHPVGNYLRDLRALDGYTVVSSCKGLKIDEYSKSEVTHPDYACSQSHALSSFERTLGGIPSVQSPKFDLGELLDVSKALTSLSLLRQTFS